jgi:hypothetical protein
MLYLPECYLFRRKDITQNLFRQYTRFEICLWISGRTLYALCFEPQKLTTVGNNLHYHPSLVFLAALIICP